MNFESQESGSFPKKIADRMFRVKMDPDGEYSLVTSEEYSELKAESEANDRDVYESYEFTDVQQEEDGSTTGINQAGKRVVLEEK